MLYRIGLTGGIASGKSTVAQMLTELGAAVLDADQVARQVVQPGEAAYRDVVRFFGEGILLPGGQIDRARLGQIVFADVAARQQLNEITHPRVLQRMEQMAERYQQQGYDLPIVMDIPLLIESHLQHVVDEIWLVLVDEETQLQRLMERNQLDRDAAMARISAQLPLAEKVKWATEIIDNNGSMMDTRRQVGLSFQAAVDRGKYCCTKRSQ